MTPDATGRSYDKLAREWQQLPNRAYGMAQLERALRFVKKRGRAFDIGCGSQGRMIDALLERGFQVEGLDVSGEMIALARAKHPAVTFHQGDISEWTISAKYDFVVAWDSVWHLPLKLQEPVLRKICDALAPEGIYLFTTAGLDGPTEKDDHAMGVPLHYGVMGIPRTLEVLAECGCLCRHLEYDQHPEMHLCVIAQKRTA